MNKSKTPHADPRTGERAQAHAARNAAPRTQPPRPPQSPHAHAHRRGGGSAHDTHAAATDTRSRVHTRLQTPAAPPRHNAASIQPKAAAPRLTPKAAPARTPPNAHAASHTRACERAASNVGIVQRHAQLPRAAAQVAGKTPGVKPPAPQTQARAAQARKPFAARGRVNSVIQRMEQQSWKSGWGLPSIDDFDDFDGSEEEFVEKTLPFDKAQVAAIFTRLLKQLGHQIFLSGGAVAYLQGSTRPVKDLDFRIRLPYSFKSARGRMLIEGINARLGPGAKKFRINDTSTGYTILGEIDGVEVSISNTPLPSFGAFETHELSELEGEVWEPPSAITVISIDDNIFDKMLSLMFRDKPQKMQTDLQDLLQLLNVSVKPVAFYACNFYKRRGGVYQYSSKRAEIDRHVQAEEELDEDEARVLKWLVTNPEKLMLKNLLSTLRDCKGLLNKLSKLKDFKELKVTFQGLCIAVETASNKARSNSLPKLPRSYPLGAKTKAGQAARTRKGSWTVE